MVLCAFVLAACGGDDSTTGASSSETAAGETESTEIQTIKVTGFPVIALAPAFLAEERGIMAEHGLKMEFKAAAAGPAIVTSLASGQADVAGAISPQTVLTARAAGIPLKLMSPFTVTPDSQAKVDLGVYTTADTGIKTPKDLEGRKIGVVTVKAASQLTIEQAMLAEGADPSTVEWVQVPLPDAATALDAGRIEAAFLAEPFTSFAKGEIDDLVQVPLPLTEKVRTSPATGWATSDQALEDKGEMIASFQEAVTEATELIIKDPNLARQTAAEFTEVPPEVLNTQNLPEWTLEISEQTLDTQSKDGAELGYQKEYLPLEDWLVSPSE